MDQITMHEGILSIEEVDPSRYEGIDLDRLVVYAAARVSELGEELSLEDIIVATFKLFPKKFSLLGYPQFPDGTRVEKCLWRCKGIRRGWIGGKTAHGYTTTEKGVLISAQVKKMLEIGGTHNKKASSQTRRKETIIAELTASHAFRKFVENRGNSITESEFCNALQGTLDSLKEALLGNLTSLKTIASELGRNDVSDFLNYLDKSFSKFLNNGRN
jgi:hypothetical protein